MKKSKKENLADPRSVQRLARPYNLPDCLLQPKNVKLLPLYVRIEQLSLEKGHCYAGDQSLAEYLGTNKSTIVRQRCRLEKLGLVIREGEAKNRSLFPWWQWAAREARTGNLEGVNRLLAAVVDRPYQGNIEFDEPIEGGKNPIAPPHEEVLRYCRNKYGSTSFHELTEGQQYAFIQSGQFALQNVADLYWLFEQEVTPKAYDLFRRLQPGQRSQVQQHAPAYAYSNRDNADMMMNLSRYLNPFEPGYKLRIRDRASRKNQATGRKTNTAQAVHLANSIQVTDQGDIF